MNTKTLLSSLVIASLFLISCKKETATETPPVNSSDTEVQAMVPETDTTKTLSTAVEPTQPNASGGNPNTIMNTSPATAMNPAHGLAGHRCDIPVGAPLNSPAPQQASTAMPNQAPAATPANATATTAPGMNPPHGQVGHLCEIPVGSPLPQS